MSPQEFRDWLIGCLNGRTQAVPTFTTDAEEIVNGELRPSVVVGYPSGEVFVITIGKAAA